jgi:hypothetical protein
MRFEISRPGTPLATAPRARLRFPLAKVSLPYARAMNRLYFGDNLKRLSDWKESQGNSPKL